MISWLRFAVVYCLFLSAAAYMSFHQQTAAPLAQPLSEFPAELGAWRVVRQDTFNQATLAVLRPTDYLSRRYQDPNGKAVDLYIGYHDGGQGSGPIHSPKNCLPGNGWYEVSSSAMDMDVNGERVRLAQAVYGQEDRKELFVYWFIVRGRTLSNEMGLKVAEIINSVRNGQRGASFVRLSVATEDDPQKAMSTLETFLQQAYPAIHSFMSS